jgi:hypothetical protein
MGFGNSALLGIGKAVKKVIASKGLTKVEANTSPSMVNTGNTKMYGQRTGSTVSSASVTSTVRTEPRMIDDVNTVPRNIMDWKPLK